MKGTVTGKRNYNGTSYWSEITVIGLDIGRDMRLSGYKMCDSLLFELSNQNLVRYDKWLFLRH